jgi:benzylsuccinate CoA-transferase BbsF subunit
VNPYGAYTDFIVPRFAVASILAAVDYRRRTGRGLHLDMSQLEASIHFSAPTMLDRAVNGREQGLRGNRHPALAPHGAYPCLGEDRWIAIVCRGDREWEGLRDVLDPSGRGEIFDGRFASLLGRKSHEDDLDRVIGDSTRTWDRRDLMEALQGTGVPAGVVSDPRDLFEDPQLRHRRHFTHLDHPEIGPYATDQTEAHLSRTPGGLDRPAPLLGEHTEHVLTDMMGLSPEEYRSLKDDGVLE